MTAINDFPNYLIYEDGRVFSIKSDRFLKYCISKAGYPFYQLYDKNYKKRTKDLHRLLAIAFIPNPNGKPEVDHINRIRSDYRLENLRWATLSENCQNKGMLKNNTTGYKNITVCDYGYRYIKKINGVSIRKRFKTLEEAITFKNNYENLDILHHDT